MGALKYKILRDLWGHKGRTLQIMLIIGLGTAAIGMILGTRNLIIPEMEEMWQSIDAPSIFLFVGPPVSDDELHVQKSKDSIPPQ